MADLTGRLNIKIKCLDGGLQASIGSTRPIAASRVFVGKTIEETIAGVPSLFSVCSTAQACACVSACEAALGWTPSPAVIRLRRLLVDAETIKEHLWRILLDWPRFLGESPQETAISDAIGAFFRLRAMLTATTDPLRPKAYAVQCDISAATRALGDLARLSARQVLGAQTTDWLASMQTPKDLLGWAENTDSAAAGLVREVAARGWGSAGRNPVRALPPLPALNLNRPLSGLDTERFVAEPLWQGEPRESSPFTRQCERAPVAALTRDLGNGLLPRLAAQLVELASLHETMRTGLEHLDEPVAPLAESTGNGLGIAQVAAARGLLIHRVAVDQGRVRDYRILAPTEWNFHPRGVVARGLSNLPVADPATLERQASLFVTSVDPCVDYTLSVS